MLGTYEVIPRYTCGSPAALDEATALRVAKQEREAHAATLEGVYGDDAKREAERLGLDGIVLENCSRGSRRVYRDVLTSIEYRDVPYACFRHPDALIVDVKGLQAHYYYRRVKVWTGKAAAERLGIDSLRVLKAIAERFAGLGIDWRSNEACAIWNARRNA